MSLATRPLPSMKGWMKTNFWWDNAANLTGSVVFHVH